MSRVSRNDVTLKLLCAVRPGQKQLYLRTDLLRPFGSELFARYTKSRGSRLLFCVRNYMTWVVASSIVANPHPPQKSQNVAHSGISIVPSDAERVGHTVPWNGVTTSQVLTSTSGRFARILDRALAAFL
jgi:hypothetical protein